MTALTLTKAPIETEADIIAIAEILAAEELAAPPAEIILDVADIVQATAEANGGEAQDQAVQAPAENEASDEALDETVRSFTALFDAVSNADVEAMQRALTAAFADRAAYEREAHPENDNIQKTLSKVQKGHLAHGISKAMRAIGMDPNYLNKSEVSGKRRNVYALEKLQDLIYGASSGWVKNAINAAVLVSMVRLEKAGVPFTGLVAKACASDKIAVDAQLKSLLARHTVSESTASTQSSSTMTALEDLGAVVNMGTQKLPVWKFSDSAIGQRLREIALTKLMPAAGV
jgi:hypothetical protein